MSLKLIAECNNDLFISQLTKNTLVNKEEPFGVDSSTKSFNIVNGVLFLKLKKITFNIDLG